MAGIVADGPKTLQESPAASLKETAMQQDLDSLVPGQDFSRRLCAHGVGQQLRGRRAAGDGARRIKTSSEGLDVGEVFITVGDFKMPAYRAVPAGKRNAAGDPRHAARSSACTSTLPMYAALCAPEAYMAIAPELFVRQGDARAAMARSPS